MCFESQSDCFPPLRKQQTDLQQLVPEQLVKTQPVKAQPVQELTAPEQEPDSEWQARRSLLTMKASTWSAEPGCEEQTPSQVATLSPSAVRQEEAA